MALGEVIEQNIKFWHAIQGRYRRCLGDLNETYTLAAQPNPSHARISGSCEIGSSQHRQHKSTFSTRLSLGLVRYPNRKQRPWVSKASTRRLRTSAPRQQDLATPVTILVQDLVRLLCLIKFHEAPYEPVALSRVE
jgi:hypothetical protein